MNQTIPETPPDYDHTRIEERPDGFYWRDEDSDQCYGPFATLVDAVADMQYDPESDFEPGESLEEVEAELGITGWVDPDTGELAEDTFTHIEDH